jgi:hypothetical protein
VLVVSDRARRRPLATNTKVVFEKGKTVAVKTEWTDLADGATPEHARRIDMLCYVGAAAMGLVFKYSTADDILQELGELDDEWPVERLIELRDRLSTLIETIEDPA